jgi:hypothetical protein
MCQASAGDTVKHQAESVSWIKRPERESLRDTVRAFIAEQWSWRRTAERLLDLAQKRR